MRNLYPSFSVIIFLISLVTACSPISPWKEEAEILLSRAAALEELHDDIESRIDSLWDATTAQLKQKLPPDVPPVDREIFLNSRNADHIRMFMSFKVLDPALQELVHNAGRYDEMLANQLRSLAVQLQEFEQQKIEFLQKVAQHDKAASRAYTDRFIMITH